MRRTLGRAQVHCGGGATPLFALLAASSWKGWCCRNEILVLWSSYWILGFHIPLFGCFIKIPLAGLLLVQSSHRPSRAEGECIVLGNFDGQKRRGLSMMLESIALCSQNIVISGRLPHLGKQRQRPRPCTNCCCVSRTGSFLKNYVQVSLGEMHWHASEECFRWG